MPTPPPQDKGNKGCESDNNGMIAGKDKKGWGRRSGGNRARKTPIDVEIIDYMRFHEPRT